MTYDRNKAPKLGAPEWREVAKAKAARVLTRKAWKAAQEACVLFVAGSATETAAYVKLTALRGELLEAGEANLDAEAAYEAAYSKWWHVMHAASNHWTAPDVRDSSPPVVNMETGAVTTGVVGNG